MTKAEEVLALCQEARIKALEFFHKLAPANKNQNPWFKVIKIKGKEVLVIAYNEGGSAKLTDIVNSEPIQKAVGGNDTRVKLELSDADRWNKLVSAVTWDTNKRLIVVSHNGNVQFDGVPK